MRIAHIAATSIFMLAGCGASSTSSDSPVGPAAPPAGEEVQSDNEAGVVDESAVSEAKPADPCPSLMTPVPAEACDPPQGYGLTKEQPLEWGKLGGSGSELWRQRLACADGSRPVEVTRSGNVGKIPSSSPAAPGTGAEPMDFVDKWVVRCGASPEPVIVYSNMYRCGSHCPPSGLSLLPAEAALLLVDARQANKEGRPERAIELADKAVALAPDFEVTWSRAALVHHVAKSPAKAIEYMRRASEIAPFDLSHLTDLGYMLTNQGQHEEARAALEKALIVAPDGSASWADALCMKAEVDRQLGDQKLADTQAAQACKAGEKRCCKEER